MEAADPHSWVQSGVSSRSAYTGSAQHQAQIHPGAGPIPGPSARYVPVSGAAMGPGGAAGSAGSWDAESAARRCRMPGISAT